MVHYVRWGAFRCYLPRIVLRNFMSSRCGVYSAALLCTSANRLQSASDYTTRVFVFV